MGEYFEVYKREGNKQRKNTQYYSSTHLSSVIGCKKISNLKKQLNNYESNPSLYSYFKYNQRNYKVTVLAIFFDKILTNLMGERIYLMVEFDPSIRQEVVIEQYEK